MNVYKYLTGMLALGAATANELNNQKNNLSLRGFDSTVSSTDKPSFQPSDFPSSQLTASETSKNCESLNMYDTNLDNAKIEEFLELAHLSNTTVENLCNLKFNATESLDSCAQIMDFKFLNSTNETISAIDYVDYILDNPTDFQENDVCLTMIRGDAPNADIQRCDNKTIYQTLASIGLNCNPPATSRDKTKDDYTNLLKDNILYFSAAQGCLILSGVAFLGYRQGSGHGLDDDEQTMNAIKNLGESIWGNLPGIIVASGAIITTGIRKDGQHDILQDSDTVGPELALALIEALALGFVGYQIYNGPEQSGIYQSAKNEIESKDLPIAPQNIAVGSATPPPSKTRLSSVAALYTEPTNQRM